MKTRKAVLYGFPLTFLAILSTQAYEVDNHASMSQSAFEKAAVGLTRTDLEKRTGLTNTQGTYDSIVQVIQYGAQAEDGVYGVADKLRPGRHFFNPLTGEGLRAPVPIGGQTSFDSSPEWVIDNDSQGFSYPELLASYEAALLAPDINGYLSKWTHVFRSVGQIVHHIQDMAQPAHVRNDIHVNSRFAALLWPDVPFNPSPYEVYSHLQLPYIEGLHNSPYHPVSFPRARDYWSSGGLKGIADFTNMNFLSPGTNFQMLNGQPAPSSDFPKPVPLSTSRVPIATLLPVEGPVLCDRMMNNPRVIVPPGATCDIEFHSSNVKDNYDGSLAINERAASYSVFNKYLLHYNVRYIAISSIYGAPSIYVNQLFTLNQFNFDAGYRFLLPRAVAYSTGLIDFIFRGQMEIAPPDQGVYGVVDHSPLVPHEFKKIRLKLKNASKAKDVNGAETDIPLGPGSLRAVVRYYTNPCYEENLSGEVNSAGQFPSGCTLATYMLGSEMRAAVSKPIQVGGVNNELTSLEFDFSSNPIPVGVRDVMLQVVFKGKVGEEETQLAVATKNLSEPTYISVLNNTDYFVVDGVLKTPAEIEADPALKARVGSRNTSPEPFVSARMYIGNTPISDLGSIQPRNYSRIAVLADLDLPTPMPPIVFSFQYQVPSSGFTIGTSFVPSVRNQLQREPGTLSTIGFSRGFHHWYLLWISKAVGDLPPATAVTMLPAIEPDPGPTAFTIQF